MLKITPYLGVFVLIVSIAGLWFPLLGYFLLLVFATIFITSPCRGRWFCGNLCPRGSFNDFWLDKVSRKKKIPKSLKKYRIFIPLFVILSEIIAFRFLNVQGIVNQVGMAFVIMCLATTSIAIIAGIIYSPRAWCTFCPMGTVQSRVGKWKYQLQYDVSRCTDCSICEKNCPMQLEVHISCKDPDCIKCGRCIITCPSKALAFEG